MNTVSKMTLLVVLLCTAVTYNACAQKHPAQVLYDTSIDSTNKMRDEYNDRAKFCKPFMEIANNNCLIVDENCPTLLNIFKELTAVLEIPMPQILVAVSTEMMKNNAYYTGDLTLCNAITLQNSEQDAGVVIIGENLLIDPKLGLTYSELKAVIAHELAHLKHKHVPIRNAIRLKLSLATLASYIAYCGLVYQYSSALYNYLDIPNYIYSEKISYFNRHNLISYLTISALNMIFGTAKTIVLNKKIRIQEKEADLTSIEINSDPEALISALEKIHAMIDRQHNLPNAIKNTLLTAFSEHPLVNDRAQYLREKNTIEQ